MKSAGQIFLSSFAEVSHGWTLVVLLLLSEAMDDDDLGVVFVIQRKKEEDEGSLCFLFE